MDEKKIELLALEAGVLARESKLASTTPERKKEIRRRIGEICGQLNMTRREVFDLDHKHGGHPKYGRTKRIRDGEDIPAKYDDTLLNADGKIHVR